jgi:hypothetical protein
MFERQIRHRSGLIESVSMWGIENMTIGSLHRKSSKRLRAGRQGNLVDSRTSH